MAAAASSWTRECKHDLITTTREHILETVQPNNLTVPRHQTFYPTQALRRILTLHVVQQILGHHLTNGEYCEECAAHLNGSPIKHPNERDAERIVGTDSAINLFALLVNLKFPLLIGAFLSTYQDGELPSPRFFTLDYLSNRLLSHLSGRRGFQHFIATDFEELKWRFSAPSFDKQGTFQLFDDHRTVMPYLKEELIDEGAYGKVFKVWINRGYCSRQFLKSIGDSSSNYGRNGEVILARKEYKDSGVIRFLKERTNLELIEKLKHPHLIHVKQTYQLGVGGDSKFNILFPCAKSNLYNYLRGGQAPRRRQIFRNPLWEQVLGFTEGLAKIINPGGQEGMKGYHLDLKPQNILVFQERAPGLPTKDVLKISDFGQSEFVSVDGAGSGSTSLIGANGTDAYAPPERIGIGATYDVFSLGIIVVEILAFTVRGVDGLTHPETGLDSVRHTNGRLYPNSRFYSDEGEAPVIKEEILGWLESLYNDPSLQESESRQFARSIGNLAQKMLNPDPTKRDVIHAVVSKMRQIFGTSISGSFGESPISWRNNDEKILVDFKTVSYFPEGISKYSEQSAFFVCENSSAQLRIFVGSIRDACHQRQEMKLIPLFQHCKQTDDSNYFAFSFESARNGFGHSLKGKFIVVEDEKHARNLQAALINHEISKRYSVTNLSLKLRISITKNLKAVCSNIWGKLYQLAHEPRSEDPERAEVPWEEVTPLWIELWLEKRKQPLHQEDHHNMVPIEKDNKLRRLDREAAVGKDVPLGRAIIYCTDRTIIIPFTKEGAIMNRPKEDMSDQLTFLPMDKKQREFFTVSYIGLGGGENSAQPGIPMCHELLSKEEDDNKMQCESLVVDFAHWQDAQSFYNLFRQQKSRWQSLIGGDETKIPQLRTPG